jgi:hypothetical protein
MNKLLYLLFIIACWSCSQNSGTEKYQRKRDHITNVREKVKDIDLKDIFFSSMNRLYIAGNYLVISDFKSSDKLIHIFDKDDFSYMTSVTTKGKGPGEITIIGHIASDEVQHKFYVTDHGKQCIFGYDLDSVLTNPAYKPGIKLRMKRAEFPVSYQYFADTLCIGEVIKPIGNTDFSESAAKWNMYTGEIQPMKYTHPDIEKKRIALTASMKHHIYIEFYQHHDLITICGIDGKLKCNIYGPKWDSRKTNRVHHYGKGVFCNDKIVVSYSGGNNFTDEYYPTKFFVFNTAGDYLQTLDVGYMITDFCYDTENNRIILSLNEEIQFAYLPLDGMIE